MSVQAFSFMTKEEHQKFLEDERKKKLLESLTSTSKFSVSNVKKIEDEPEPINSPKEDKNFEELAKIYKIEESPEFRGTLDEDRWSTMVEDFEVMLDPFNDISNSEQFKYKNSKEDEDYYDKRFSKEYSLLHALLSQVEKDSKAVNTKIKELLVSRKPGIGKYSVVDLWNTSNSMHTTKLQTIKEIANIKKLASELKLKEMKNNPPENDNIENSASNYYNTILKGGRQNFINALNGGVSSSSLDSSIGSSLNMVTEDDEYQTPTRGLSTPMNLKRDGYEETDDEEYTTTYIETENANVQVYVQRFDDGEMEFCALDEDGRGVPGYPLPDPSLLSTLTIRPDSSYTFDSYGRKYKIIDFGTDFDEVEVNVNNQEDDEYY